MGVIEVYFIIPSIKRLKGNLKQDKNTGKRFIIRIKILLNKD